ncbi:MAG: stage 0 sporulation protein [Candidatus Omnitrophica bacterium]|nr:stage 0 sporulation protein [Candidatus Omnitrophota bacterium]
MDKVIEVRVGDYRSVGFFDAKDVECDRGDYVILEVEKGTEFGEVISEKGHEAKRKADNILGKVVRSVTVGDLNQIENNRIKAQDAISTCVRKVNERRVDMQIVKSEYTFDCSKIIFFFTADGRVDFRGLVKDLAKIFRVRIELRQIGVRDKAKIVGGYGVCGRAVCCSSYMKSFHPLSIKMAKEQALPLNPSRISGTCGRIKCCMAYEFLVYKEMARSLPRVGEKVSIPEGKGHVREVDILKRFVYIDIGEGKVIKVVYPPKPPVSAKKQAEQ